MGLFGKKKYLTVYDDGTTAYVTREERVHDLYENFQKRGTSCTVILPEKEVSRQRPLRRAAATGILGFQGFALTEESTQYKRFSGTIRPVAKGLVLAENGSISDKEIRIPWESLVKAIADDNDFSLKLIDGTSIYIKSGTTLKKFEEYRNMIIDYINSKACGAVKDGWD